MSSLYLSVIHRNPAALHIAIAAITLLTILLASSSGDIQAQESFTINGKVINGTEGASVPEGIAVLLLVTGADGRLIGTDQTATADGGRFEFQQAPISDGGTYAFSVDYAQVFYGASLSLGDLSSDLELIVYEPTQDATVVKVTNQVMVIGDIDAKNRTISAIEFVRLTNTSDRTLLPDLNAVGQLSFLRFALPPLADELDVGSDMPGGDIVSIGTGFALTSPVLPGDHFVDFSFVFPYEGDEVSYRQSLPQGADVYRVMVPQRLSTVGTDSLESVSAVEQEGTAYRAWEGYDYEPGQGLTLRLTGLPQPGFGARLENSITGGEFWKIAIPSAVGAVLAVLLLFGVFRPRFKAETPLGAGIAGEEQDTPGRESAIREIASLDERFHQGNLDEADYLKEREGLISQVLGPHDAGQQASQQGE